MASENPDVRAGWFACGLILLLWAWFCFSVVELSEYPEAMGDSSYHEERNEAELVPK